MFMAGFKPGTFCISGKCDNHYTTESHIHLSLDVATDGIVTSPRYGRV